MGLFEDMLAGYLPLHGKADTAGVADSATTATTSTTATNVTAANEATDTTCFPLFATAATGAVGAKTNAALKFNSNTGLLETTTIKAITGLIRPDRGRISICGLPHDRLEARTRIGFMAESPYVYNHLSGREFLEFHAELLDLPRDRVAGRVGELLELVSMSSHAGRAMRTYSKGMLRRLSLAQALLGRPELLILDEPMSGLDPVGRKEFRDLILELKGQGKTIF